MILLPKGVYMEFTKLTKLIFSSISARSSRYAYFNLPEFEESIVLSNCAPDLIAEYRPEFCSIHIVSPGDEYMEKIKKMLHINDSTDPIVVKSFFITKVVSNYSLDSVEFIYNYDNGFITCRDLKNNKLIEVKNGKKKEEEETDDEEKDDSEVEVEEDTAYKMDTEIYKLRPLDIEVVAGSILNIPHVVNCLANMLDLITIKLNYVLDDQMKVHTEMLAYTEAPEIEYTHGNWYRRFVNIGKLNGKNVFMLLVDGLDNPSIKEFVKKLYGKKALFSNSSFEQYVFFKDDHTLQSVALTICDKMEIISMRPYAKAIIL